MVEARQVLATIGPRAFEAARLQAFGQRQRQCQRDEAWRSAAAQR